MVATRRTSRALDEAFRRRGWREAGHISETVFTFRVEPWKNGGEVKPEVREYPFRGGGHKVDNYKSRVALEVEWNAKDGNLDRDLANFRVLHEAGIIDVGVMITRAHQRTRWAANYLAEAANRIRYKRTGERIILLGTSTTTNLERVTPRVARGDAGGCPTLIVAITELCYAPRPHEPALPPYTGPARLAGVPEAPEDV